MDESLVYVGGVPCWILEYTAKDAKAKVSRRVYWIGKENYVTYKGEMYNQKGELQKELTCENISKIDGYWTTGKSTMTNVLTKHTTVYEIKDISYDKPVNANFFTVAALERGQVK
ncbi:MAG: outer membrane lipoprotein-sorting protein [Treponema sp.]|nr:outer membrane lipoprotein-sorting protein [Treponema sp.]